MAVTGKNATVDILRRGISLIEVSDMCCLCKIDHLLIHCDVASSLWGHFVKVNGMVWRNPGSLVVLFEALTGVSFSGCGLILWRIISFSIMCSIWKERNERILRGKESSWEDIVTTISLRIAKWASVRKECSDLRIDDLFHN